VRALVVLLIAASAGAQQPSPSFDAASIKQNRSALNGNGGGGIRPGGRVSMRNATVRLLILVAYGLQDYQLSGGPGWIETTGYDIEARPASAADPKTSRLMLQNLLAERFSLKVHHEDAMVNGFHLVVDKGGSKLKVSDAPGVGFRVMGSDWIQGSGDMLDLASTLTASLRAPVEDRTGIAGSYDIDLKWTADAAAGSASEPSVSIFAAIRQQLGLSLETAKVPIDKVVIDRAERPTEN
jgi:uncharacterized protein (TIGR03435 family)